MSLKGLIVLVLLFGSCLIFSNGQVKGSTLPTKERSSYVIDSRGWGHVCGEIDNTAGPTNDTFQITATFTAGGGSVLLGSVASYTMLDVVKKGENASFNIILANETNASQVTDWSFGVSDTPISNVPYRLNVTQTSNSTDSNGNFHVVGTVKNNMTSPAKNATFVQVIATFKGGTGNNTVIYADWSYASPINLTTGSQGTFEIIALNTTRIWKVYLKAQCSEYKKVTVDDFSLRAVPPLTQSVAQGTSATYDLRDIPANSSTTPFSVAFTASGLPQGATATFSPTNNPFVGTRVNLTITTSSALGVGVGDFLVVISGTGAGVVHRVPLILTVTAANDFALAISPSSWTIAQGNEATYAITAQFGGTFSSPINLNYSNIPAGYSASFDRTTLTPSLISTSFRISTNLSTPLGTREFTVCGSGGTPTLSHCVPASIDVTPSAAPYFTLSVTGPSAHTVLQGGSTTFTVTVNSFNGFAQSVQLSLTNLPAGTVGLFNPGSVTGSGQSTLNITTSPSTAIGTYNITITGDGPPGFADKVTYVTLTVSSASEPDFALYVFPETLSVIRNESGIATIQVVSVNNFEGIVTLTLQNYPAGVTYSIQNEAVAPLSGGYVYTKLTIQTSSSTSLGSHTMNLRGSSGSKTHSTPLELVVINGTRTPSLPFPSFGKCIIATATYGSELSPEVQFLRGFRDNRVLTTVAGTEFMKAFNAWYYSFSPYVASWIVDTPSVKDPAKILLVPLLSILHLSEMSYAALIFAPEAAVTVAGIVASLLIGVIYLGPILTFVRGRIIRRSRKLLVWSGSVLTMSVLLLVAGLLACISPVVMIASSLLVLSCVAFGALSPPILASKILSKI